MNEQIPPILRPERVRPVKLADLASRFALETSARFASIGEGGNIELLTGISMNTNDLRAGDLFVAMPGLKTHGARFVAKALENGAVAIVTDAAGELELANQTADEQVAQALAGIPVLLLENPRTRLGELAAYVYGNVGEGLPKLFATTGTNGKTSTTYLLEGILRQLGEVTGLTSTAERHIAGEVIVSRLTTPESTEMQALIARMRERDVTAIAIEVSAQALSQLRVDGLQFDVAGFTNLSHDHLDDYPDLGSYLEAKAELFTPKRAKRGVICIDTEFGAKLAKTSQIAVKTIASEKADGANSDYSVVVIEETPKHTSFEFVRRADGSRLTSTVPLLGAHMVANAGLAIAMLLEAGYPFERIAAAIAAGINAYLPGRTERVSGETGPDVYVDFGHSPDAFLNTLAAVRKVTKGKLIFVFGADGDRDPSKRPAMAQVGAEGCDILVITDHHPRFEDPASIRATLVAAAKQARPEMPIFEVSPPEAAIRKAVSLAGANDAILWCGPGHQDYRDIRGVRTPYSARHEAREALKEHGWS